MQPVIFVVPGEAGPAGHKRVIAVANGVSRNISEVGRICRVRLLRHSFQLKPPDEDQLRAVHVMCFKGGAIPARRARDRWKNGPRRRIRQVVCGRPIVWVRSVAKTLPEPGVIRPMLCYDLDVKMRAEVKLPDKA